MLNMYWIRFKRIAKNSKASLLPEYFGQILEDMYLIEIIEKIYYFLYTPDAVTLSPISHKPFCFTVAVLSEKVNCKAQSLAL